MSDQHITGLPGISNAQQTNWRVVSKGGMPFIFLPGGKLVDGTKSGDAGNITGTVNADVLRAGTLMGKITVSGLYAPSIIGSLTTATLASATSATVSAAMATELVRRIGSSGTFNIVGPPTAAGTVGTETVTYSAINTTTGVITASAITAAYVAGSLLVPTDGSQTILSVIPDGSGLKVSDTNDVRCTVPWPNFPVYGVLQVAGIVNWPTDTSLQAYIAAALSNKTGGTQFVLDYLM